MTKGRHPGAAPSSPRGGDRTAGSLRLHVVVMGVSGSGKSTVARALATRLRWPMVEGDDFHPPTNIAKMAAGLPLDEADRRPWLERLVDWTSARHADGLSTVLTCSALTRHSRDILRSAAPGTAFVHLVGTAALLAARMSQRMSQSDHFMPPTLLISQLTTLEQLGPDERGIVVDASQPVEAVADQALRDLGLPTPRRGRGAASG